MILVRVTAIVLSLLSLTAAAQDPTFRAGTKLVQIDVVARSKGGPATGLIKEDFTLLDNGQPQKISFFSVRSASAAGPAGAALPPGTVTNRLEREGDATTNATVILIDQRNTPQAAQAFAIQRIVKFVQMRRPKDRKPDRVGIYTFQRDASLRAVQDLTDDTDLLYRAAASLKPRDPSFRSTDTSDMSQHAAEGAVAIALVARAI